MTEEIKTKFNEFFEFIKHRIEAGKTYHSYLMKTEHGYRGTGFYTLENKKMLVSPIDFEEYSNDEEEKLAKSKGLKARDIFDMPLEIAKVNDLIFYTISLENGFTYEIAGPQLILELIKNKSQSYLAENTHSEILIKIRKNQIKNQLELDISNKLISATKVKEYPGFVAKNEITVLLHALETTIELIFIKCSMDFFEIQTIPEIPGLTKLYVPAEENLEINEENLDEILAFFESGSEAKMNKALEIVEKNPKLKSLVEKRYLNLIKNRVGESYGLEKWKDAKLSLKEIHKLQGNEIGKDFISFSYFDSEESDLFVHFLGALVQNHLDLDKFQKEAETCTSEEELISLYQKAAKKVKKGILDEAKNHPNGWFSQLSIKIAKHSVEKLLFEKTKFDCSGNAMKAFMFYLNLNHNNSVYLDVFQSDTPEFTNFFWFLPSVPKSSWGDVELKIPESSLKFKRKASYRIGDGGSWKTLTSPKK